MSRKPKLSPAERKSKREAKAARATAQAAEKAALTREQDFDAVGLQPAASRLAANEDVAVARESRKTLLTARRQDAFDALADGMHPDAYRAARRLEIDMRTRRGEHDRGRLGERVDGDPKKGDRTDAMIQAAFEVAAVFGRIGERDAWLLSELIYPGAERTWRQTVAYVTGEQNPHAQCAVVRSACENLRHAYAAIDGISGEPMRRTALWFAPAKQA